MDLRRAATYLFADRRWWRKVGLIALVSPVPIFGQMYALGYANLTLRRMLKGHGDTVLPEAKLGWELWIRGIKIMLVTLLCALVASLLCLPLFFNVDPGSVSPAPALIQSFDGPSSLVLSIVSSVVTAIVLARYALTGSVASGFNPLELWNLFRAEPAIWLVYALAGYVVTEGPYAVVWLLPLHGGWDIAGTVFACSVLWTYGLMVNTHLIGQAFHWSRKTAALRAAQVRYRW
ncbi:MAG: DUF4013 domain-containing protein [Thermomicrobiales bacterium]|nr:DUF4013 domain-containing protein [Thermomicrobiales bacterium]